MGYNSRFRVTVIDRRPNISQVLTEFVENNENAQYCLNLDGSTEETGKWYDWKADFTALSLASPGFLFNVYREGDESGDVEVGYFLNGQYQGGKAEFTLPDFKEPDDDE